MFLLYPNFESEVPSVEYFHTTRSPKLNKPVQSSFVKMTTGFPPPTLQLSFLPVRLETRTDLIQGDFSSPSSVTEVDPGPQMDCEGCVGISNAFCVANDDVSAFTARINSRRRLRKRYNRFVISRYSTGWPICSRTRFC